MKSSNTIRSTCLKACTILALFAVLPVTLSAQLNVAALNTPYTITFDSDLPGVNNGAFTGAGFTSAPAVGQLNSNAWASTGMSDGALAFGGSNTTGDYARGVSTAPGGTGTTGGFYSIAAPNVGSNSLGIKPGGSDWTPGTVTLRVQNTTGGTMTSMDVAYTIWNNNSQARSNSFNFSWSTDNSTYTPVGALDFTSPATSDAFGYVSYPKSTTVSSLSLANNDYIYLRWSGDDVGGSGSRDEFALDDVSVTGYGAVGSNTSVEFVSTSSTASEGAGTINLALAINNPDAVNATNVTITATGATGRVTSFTTPVTFAGGSSANENVTVTLDDNAICDGDEDVVFTITGISGGQGTPFIEPNAASYTLTVTDNDALAVPVATTPTVINSEDFTATWNASAGATGYELDVYTNGPLPTSELFFSEYVEGSSNNKYLEIYNGTGANVDLSHYTVQLFANGSSTPTNTNILSGTLNNNSVIVLRNSSATIYGGSSTIASACSFNGDDAVLLLNNVTGDTLDIIGSIGHDPGTEWTGSGGRSTLDKTLVRNSSVTGGITSNPATGFPSLDSEWGVLAQNNVSDLGSHSYSAIGEVMLSGYPATVGNVTSYSVTGLVPSTDYYFRVRATGGGCPMSANSNEIQVTTTAGINPILTAGTLGDFGDICLNADGGPLAFTLEGLNLTSDDVTVAALSGYTFSTDEMGTYSSTLAIAQSGGTFSQDIWVTFTPTLEQSYDGDITVGGGGAADITVAVTGSGINTGATMTTGGTASIGMDQAEINGTVTYPGCSALTEYGIEYSATQGFTPGTGTAVASTNMVGNGYTSTLTGLTPCTIYYYLAYGTNDGGTSYGSESTFETGSIAAPVATVPGTINQEDFTATWASVSGASGYRLDVSTMPGFGTTGPATLTEGFDGGSGGLPTGWSQAGLGSDYSSSGNYGAAAPSLKFDTSNDQLITALLSGPATSLSFWYKGQGTGASSSALLIEGFDGSGWSTLGDLTTIPTNFVGTWSTPLNAGDNYVQFRFTYTKASGNLAFDDVAINYAAVIPSFVPGYNDLAVAGTSQSVTGLEPSTTYYYRVRAEAGSCVSGNSNTIAVTTLSCPGNSFVVAINTDAHGDQTSWAVLDENDAYVALGGPYIGQNNTLVTETICIGNTQVNACYQFHLYDSFGDGLTGVGNWQLRSTDGRVLLGDDFADGSDSPSATPINPNYGSNHRFCLPPGPANIAPTECGIFDNMLGNKVYATKVTGAANYQFEFSDPDAGFIRRIARPYNYVHFWDMVATPLVPGVKYFARVRTDRDGPMAQQHFGGGCEMGISIPQVVICTELIQAPAYGHSCNETRTFNTSANNSFIYAKPVQGATEYQFRIINTQEGYDQTFIRSTYILQLKWNNNVAPPLISGYTYNVEMNVKVNSLYSGFCPSTCNITIDNSGNRPEASMTQVNGTATLWPNPVRDGQVNLNIDGLVDAEQNITVDIQDIYGKQVFAKEFGNNGERFSTILNLNSDIASGVYMVNITVNGQRTVQRLSIIR